MRTRLERGGETRAFFAWTQPVFVAAPGVAPAPTTSGLTGGVTGQ